MNYIEQGGRYFHDIGDDFYMDIYDPKLLLVVDELRKKLAGEHEQQPLPQDAKHES
jgi:hypothetical protein